MTKYDLAPMTHPSQIWTRGKEFIKPEALEVFGHINNGLDVIVSGPNRIGKTEFLVAQIRDIASAEGYAVVFDDIYKSQTPHSGLLYRLTDSTVPATKRRFEPIMSSRTDKRLFIADEAVAKFDDPEEIESSKAWFNLLKSKGVSLLLINAAGSPQLREKGVETYRNIAKLANTELVEHQFKRIHLPIELIREYFILSGATQDVINFAVNPDNRAIRTFGLIGEVEMALDPITTLEDLKRTLENRIKDIVGTRMGGSQVDLLNMLARLGITAETNARLYSQLEQSPVW